MQYKLPSKKENINCETIGFMLRSDKLGVTSVIRDLALSPDCYLSMIHFFRASS